MKSPGTVMFVVSGGVINVPGIRKGVLQTNSAELHPRSALSATRIPNITKEILGMSLTLESGLELPVKRRSTMPFAAWWYSVVLVRRELIQTELLDRW